MSERGDKLIHHYFGVNIDIVWHIIVNELPDVASRVEEISSTL